MRRQLKTIEGYVEQTRKGESNIYSFQNNRLHKWCFSIGARNSPLPNTSCRRYKTNIKRRIRAVFDHRRIVLRVLILTHCNAPFDCELFVVVQLHHVDGLASNSTCNFRDRQTLERTDVGWKHLVLCTTRIEDRSLIERFRVIRRKEWFTNAFSILENTSCSWFCNVVANLPYLTWTVLTCHYHNSSLKTKSSSQSPSTYRTTFWQSWLLDSKKPRIY